MSEAPVCLRKKTQIITFMIERQQNTYMLHLYIFVFHINRHLLNCILQLVKNVDLVTQKILLHYNAHYKCHNFCLRPSDIWQSVCFCICMAQQQFCFFYFTVSGRVEHFVFSIMFFQVCAYIICPCDVFSYFANSSDQPSLLCYHFMVSYVSMLLKEIRVMCVWDQVCRLHVCFHLKVQWNRLRGSVVGVRQRGLGELFVLACLLGMASLSVPIVQKITLPH